MCEVSEKIADTYSHVYCEGDMRANTHTLINKIISNIFYARHCYHYVHSKHGHIFGKVCNQEDGSRSVLRSV